MEKLDLMNVIEVQQIRLILKEKKDLIDFFDELIEKVNKQINEEKLVIKIDDGYIDVNLNLSDHSSDEESP
tara:strand:+ start:140 stop:352 length:213 start_codon:yes stop_codon:yes gene_type:complete